MNLKNIEKYLQEKILPDLEKSRGGFDRIHTLEVVDWLKQIISHNPELKLDETVLTIAAYAHDWGYSEIFKDGQVMNFEIIENAKKLHMELGAKKIEKLLQADIFSFLTAEQKVRCVHLVAVHDKKFEIKAVDEIILMEADVLSGLNINTKKPILDAESNVKFMDSMLNIRIPKFITEFSKNEAKRLIRIRKDYFRKLEKSYKVLGVRIDNLKKSEIFKKVEGFLSENKFHQIATINPEFILEAQNNLCFRTVLDNCALNIADGFGIKLAFWKYGWHLKTRMAGVDLMMEILKLANKNNLEIFIVAKKDGLSSLQEIKMAITKIHPNLKINGVELNVDAIQCLSIKYPCVLFCNFGAPDQEIFIDSQKDAIIRIAVGVGGSFDFLTKKIKRAPIFMSFMGLEWLWRIFQPQQWQFKKKRLKRIWKAVVIFPIKIILCKEK
jgi:N-acetylglucosaminyldiphosphoundecaprenol N-acetyl-beta-D-mannosaminyltransferase